MIQRKVLFIFVLLGIGASLFGYLWIGEGDFGYLAFMPQEDIQLRINNQSVAEGKKLVPQTIYIIKLEAGAYDIEFLFDNEHHNFRENYRIEPDRILNVTFSGILVHRPVLQRGRTQERGYQIRYSHGYSSPGELITFSLKYGARILPIDFTPGSQDLEVEDFFQGEDSRGPILRRDETFFESSQNTSDFWMEQEWETEEWKYITLSRPKDWKKTVWSNGIVRWGTDVDNKKGVFFEIFRSLDHYESLTKRSGANLKFLKNIEISGVPSKKYDFVKGGAHYIFACTNEPLADGMYLVLSGYIIDEVFQEDLSVIDCIVDSIKIPDPMKIAQEPAPPARGYWRQRTWERIRLRLPGLWKRNQSSGNYFRWGTAEGNINNGVFFEVFKTDHVFDTKYFDQVCEVKEAGDTKIAGQTARIYDFSHGDWGLRFRVVCLEKPLKDDTHLILVGYVANKDWDAESGVFEKIAKSIRIPWDLLPEVKK